jgi:hypothetical protein
VSTSEVPVVINTYTATISTTKSLVYASTITAPASPAVVAPPQTSVITIAPIITESLAHTLTHTIQPTEIYSYTHVDATYYYADLGGRVTSTSTTEWLIVPTITSATSSCCNDNTQDSGFNSWSPGAKAGLIVGVVFAALILLWLLICCYKRNTAWVTHDWRWAGAVEGGAPGMANANMAAGVQPGMVISPVGSVGTPSYGYATPVYR